MTTHGALRRGTLAAALMTCALVLPVTGAQAKVRVSVLGWTTQGGSTSPQVKNKATIETCLDAGTGQRSLRVIFRGRGLPRGPRSASGAVRREPVSPPSRPTPR